MYNDVIEFQLKKLKDKFNEFEKYEDYHNFVFLCLKYFYFNTPTSPFVPENVIPYLTDGSRDGGIDAIFNDPNSEHNDIVIIQSKYYEKTDLTDEDIVGELYKIEKTLNELDHSRIHDFNDKLVTAYRKAKSQMEDDGVIKIMLFTSYSPKSKKELNKLEKAKSIIKNYDIELIFGQDIATQIEMCENQKQYVDSDILILDKPDNFLEYNESVIVNISALSLQELQNRRRNGLLGLNLRYFVKNKDVDDDIEKTIQNDSENFWYKNNGILIICDGYKIEDRQVIITNFSIINGGQTTNRIGHTNIDHDFYLQCKIVKNKGNTEEEKNQFVTSIAKATNSQKPIKKSDLKAADPEQINLQNRLKRTGVYYMIKNGDTAPKEYDQPWMITNMDKLGKICLATVLQQPGTARSNSSKMYDDLCFDKIFKKTHEQYLADSIKIGYYYDRFMKQNREGYSENEDIPMMENGKTFQLSCITLLSKIKNNLFTWDQVNKAIDDVDQIKLLLGIIDGQTSIIKNHLEKEEEYFFKIFEYILTEVLSPCFSDAVEKAKEEGKALAPSNFLKLDNNYYKIIIKRLSRFAQRKEEFKLLIENIL